MVVSLFKRYTFCYLLCCTRPVPPSRINGRRLTLYHGGNMGLEIPRITATHPAPPRSPSPSITSSTPALETSFRAGKRQRDGGGFITFADRPPPPCRPRPDRVRSPGGGDRGRGWAAQTRRRSLSRNEGSLPRGAPSAGNRPGHIPDVLHDPLPVPRQV